MLLGAPLGGGQSAHPARPGVAPARQVSLGTAYGKLPLAFEANGGRTDGRVDFIAHGRGWALFLAPGKSVLALGSGKRGDFLSTRVVGGSHRRGAPEERLGGRVNSLVGNDPAKWRTGIATYRKVRYPSVYPGIDLVYYGHAGKLEYDFVLHPGADPGRIGLDFGGARRPRLAPNGDLVVATRAGTVRQLRPIAYQPSQGRRQRVNARFAVDGSRVTMRVGSYDHSLPLVIDPLLAYSAVIGGSGNETSGGIAVGSDRSAYITGTTYSTDFPAGTAIGTPPAGVTDAFVTKLNPAGTAVVYSTYVGGGSGDYGTSIDVDDNGNAYVAGFTSSSDFPVPNGVDTSRSGIDAFAFDLNPAGGTLVWSTFIGGDGDDAARGIAVDAGHDAHVVGDTQSSNFPVSASPFQADQIVDDGFVSVLHYGSGGPLTLPYSSYLGGGSSENIEGVALDSSGATYVTGYTISTNFPVKGTGAASDPDSAGTNQADAFAAKFDTTQAGANSLVYSTYFGGSGTDIGFGIAVSNVNLGTAYVVGRTSSPTLPTPAISAPTASATDTDGFVMQVSATGGVSNNQYLGGSGDDEADAIAVQAAGYSEWILGTTKSSDFPTIDGIGPSASSTDTQLFALKRWVTSGTPNIVWSTLLGGSGTDELAKGIAIDAQNSAYITGDAGFDFPQVPQPNPSQAAFGGGATDAFAARLDQLAPTIVDPSPHDGAVVGTSSVSFTFAATAGAGSIGYFCSVADPATHVLKNTSRGSCTPPVHYTSLADGPQTFEVVSHDNAGDESDPAHARRTFTVDTQPPPAFDLSDPGDGAKTDTKPTLGWQQSHDATTVTYHLIVDGKDVQQVAESACSSGACSAQLATALVTGPHTWKVTATDAAAHSTDSSSSRSFTVVSPPTAKLTISPNPALAGSTVTFDGTGSADASHTIAKYEWDLDGDGNYELDTGTTGTTTKAYATAQTINVGLRVTDTSATSATTAGALLITSPTALGGLLGVTINDGAQYTRSPDVVVTATFPTSATTMLISNDGGFMQALQFPVQKKTPWKLDSSGPERLPKTIYVRFFTGPLPSETFQDDIILDEIPPVVQQASIAPAAGVVSPGTAAVAAKAALRKWKVKLKATDSNSGVASVQVTSSKAKPGKALRYARKLTVRSAKRPGWVRARDKAGNYSRWRKAR